MITKDPESGLDVTKDLVIYYRTNNSDKPIFIAQKSENHPDEVALMVSFTPSFLPETTGSSTFDTAFDERPQPQELVQEL